MMADGLRSGRERILQTLWFEGLGIALVGPLYAWAADAGLGESLAMIATVSVVVMVWSGIYNTLFDWLELRWIGRLASDRPYSARIAHALGHELSAMIVSCPVIYAMTSLSWLGALLYDLGLTLVYAVYAYLFHLLFDWLRPVQTKPA